MSMQENNESSSDDDTDEDLIKEYEGNTDNIFVSKEKQENKNGIKQKRSNKEKKGKESKESITRQRELENVQETNKQEKEEKEKRLEKLKKLLEKVANDYEDGRIENMNSPNPEKLSLMPMISVHFVRETDEEDNSVSSREMTINSDDNSMEEDESEETGIDSDSTEISENDEGESTESAGNDEAETSENDEDESVGIAVISGENENESIGGITDENDKNQDELTMEELNHEWVSEGEDESTTSDTSNSDQESDDSIDERCFYMTSAANIRRREMHGLPRYMQQRKKEKVKPTKGKMKKVPRQEPMANLRKIQD